MSDQLIKGFMKNNKEKLVKSLATNQVYYRLIKYQQMNKKKDEDKMQRLLLENERLKNNVKSLECVSHEYKNKCEMLEKGIDDYMKKNGIYNRYTVYSCNPKGGFGGNGNDAIF